MCLSVGLSGSLPRGSPGLNNSIAGGKNDPARFCHRFQSNASATVQRHGIAAQRKALFLECFFRWWCYITWQCIVYKNGNMWTFAIISLYLLFEFLFLVSLPSSWLTAFHHYPLIATHKSGLLTSIHSSLNVLEENAGHSSSALVTNCHCGVKDTSFLNKKVSDHSHKACLVLVFFFFLQKKWESICMSMHSRRCMTCGCP